MLTPKATYCCEGRTVIFEHLEPFPLGVSLPGMGYQVQLWTALSERRFEMFENKFYNPEAERLEEGLAESQFDTEERLSQTTAQTLQTTRTRAQQKANDKNADFHPESQFPFVFDQNKKPGMLQLEQRDDFENFKRIIFSGDEAGRVAPMLEGCQGIMRFWSYR